MDERRRYQRYSVEGIHGNMLFASEVNILNISLGGAAIEADKRLNINSEYTLKIDDNDRTINLRGMVIWAFISKSKINEDGQIIPMYQAGLKFTNVLTDSSAELIGFLERFKTEDDSRLSGLRFIIDSDHSAVLDYPFNYRVKKLSLGGMLIESDVKFEVEDRFPMEIYLEENLPVEFNGRVASCMPIENTDPQLYDVGIEFMDIAEESSAGLKAFLDTL
jgi:hypothetical protein